MKIIKSLRQTQGISQQKLADVLGVSRSTVAMWETDATQPDHELTVKIAEHFGVTTDYLLGKENTTHPGKGVKVPVLGKVVAGIPMEAIEEIYDYEEIDASLARTGEFFGLLIKGDSMSPKIAEGDIVIVRKQEDAETGEIVIARINGDDACCKRLIKNQQGITLHSFNPDYEPMFFSNQEVIDKPVSIIGKVVELRRKF